jgi:hypothetical protein
MLPMQADPIFEWHRLTEHYRQMSEGELLALADDFADLTQTAQQALRSEMRSRGLGDPETVNAGPELPRTTPDVPPPENYAPEASDSIAERAGLAFGARPPELVPDTPNPDGEDDGPHDYTWKTVLCDCDTPEEAWQLSEALKQVGIQSWIDGPRPRSGYTSFDLPNPRVLVAADQLDQARAIAARPIAPEIVAESETKVPEFTPPSCPKCGAEDPVLEGVDPANTWRCEQCDEQWTESSGRGSEEAPEPGQIPL